VILPGQAVLADYHPDMNTLWRPPTAADIANTSWARLGRPYCTGADILGETTDTTTRRQLWEGVPVGHALNLLGTMLRDLDLQDPSTIEIEAGWVSALPAAAQTRAVAALRRGRRLLVPQALLAGVKEALRHCPAGGDRGDLSDLDVVLRAVWSIGDEWDQIPEAGEPVWGAIPVSLAAEMVANQHFNVTARPLPMIARTQSVWRGGWSTAVKPALISRAGGTPGGLFRRATGCDLDDFLSIALHLYLQAQMHRHLRFPPEFFTRLGIAPAAVDRFLAATTKTLADLQQYAAGTDAVQHPWDFNQLRTTPLVRLPDGSVQIIRLGYMLERAFGQVPEFDVRDYLRQIDAGGQQMATGGREEAFRSGLDTQFETCVGQTLRRIFPVRGHLEQLYTEQRMWHAWSTKKAKVKVCDWAVDCGDVWLCLDATNRRLPQTVVGGYANPEQLDREIAFVLTGRKTDQMATTVRHLTTRLPALTHRNLSPGTIFIPLIVTPDDGLPWNPAVHNRVQEIIAASGKLQSRHIAPLGVITLEDLGLLERVVEDGHDAGRLLRRWRTQRPELALPHFLDQAGIVLRRPQWESETFDRLTDDLLDRMTAGAHHHDPGTPAPSG
jgi:hypothetical protein